MNMKKYLCVLGVSFLVHLLHWSQPVKGVLFDASLKLNSTLLTRAYPYLSWWNIFHNGPAKSPISFTKSCDSCKCGTPNMKRRIVGGKESSVFKYPWVGMLLHSNRFYCGLTLINDRYTLTAAHCVNNFKKEYMTARFLQNDRTVLNGEIIERMISKVIEHPNYYGKTFNNDIALLQLNEPIKLNNLIQPVCLPSEGDSLAGRYGLVTGWGALSETGQGSNTLQEVLVPIIDNGNCKGRFTYDVTENMFCAGYEVGQQDACQGDSGGPLHVIQNTKYQITGIVSWGDGCARPNLPGVYTRVNRYIHWIKASTGDACYC